jgi:hypothetical protein
MDAATRTAETPIWVGEPLPGVRIRRGDYLQSIMSVPCIGISGMILYGVANGKSSPNGSPAMAALFGIAGMMFGLYLLFGRFLYDAYRRRRTTYALTADTAIIKVGNDVDSVYLPDLTRLAYEPDDGNSGTVVFGVEPSQFNGMGFSVNARHASAFEFIEEGAKVYALCLQSQRKGA